MLQCTFFTACFVLDLRRIDNKQNGLLCCYKHGEDYKPSACSQADLFKHIFDKFIATALSKSSIKVSADSPKLALFLMFIQLLLILFQILIVALTCVMFGINAYGCTQLEHRSEPVWYIPHQSHVAQFMTTMENEYPSGGARGSIYFGRINYTESLDKMEKVVGKLLSDPVAQIGSIEQWPQQFILSVKEIGDHPEGMKNSTEGPRV